MPTTITPQCITPEPGHYAFGYYDRQPWDASGRYHLALRLPQQERLPRPGEAATVGVVDLQDGCRFRALGETCAWNHQQGCMTQWLPHDPGCFIYNDAVREGAGWRAVSRVCHVDRGLLRTLPRPVYILAPDGRRAATLDFGRIWFRPGYYYCAVDARTAPKLPDDVGVWVMDLATGADRLIISIAELAKQLPVPYELKDSYVWLNHLGWNCDGSRLMVLFRYQFPPGTNPWWKTFLYTFNPDGSAPRCALPHWYWAGVSHQLWGRTPREIILDANYRATGSELIVFNDGELTFRNLADGISGPAGHLNFSPDGRWVVADSYPRPDQGHTQLLRLVDLERQQQHVLREFAHGPVPGGVQDLRCDLHPRWRQDGRALSVDSICAGERKIYVLDVSAYTG